MYTQRALNVRLMSWARSAGWFWESNAQRFQTRLKTGGEKRETDDDAHCDFCTQLTRTYNKLRNSLAREIGSKAGEEREKKEIARISKVSTRLVGRGFLGGREHLASAGVEKELRRHARSSRPKGNLRGSNQFRKLNLKRRN